MKCSACGSAAVSTGLGNHVSCFDCGVHAESATAADPSMHGDSFPAADADVEVSADDTEDGED